MDETTSTEKLYQLAGLLAVATILYNLVEGAVSVGFGIADETVSLLGFGVDSFVEVVSGIGVWHMVRRIRARANAQPDLFERRALRITGTAFYLLTAGLIATAVLNLAQGHAPVTTFWGIVISLISIASMWLLVHYKVRVGRLLESPAVLADAACSRACVHFSIVLLAASAGYALTGIGGIDSIGALGIAVIAAREGREAFAKARGGRACGEPACRG